MSAGLLLASCGAQEEPEQTAVAPEPAVSAQQPEPAPTPPPPEPAPEPAREPETATASYMADTRWAPGSEGILLLGLNGGEYPPYAASLVREVQRFLFDQDLYDGPVTGVLDEETMQAVAEFQQEQGIVQSGVPSPETREAMDQLQGDTAT